MQALKDHTSIIEEPRHDLVKLFGNICCIDCIYDALQCPWKQNGHNQEYIVSNLGATTDTFTKMVLNSLIDIGLERSAAKSFGYDTHLAVSLNHYRTLKAMFELAGSVVDENYPLIFQLPWNHLITNDKKSTFGVSVLGLYTGAVRKIGTDLNNICVKATLGTTAQHNPCLLIQNPRDKNRLNLTLIWAGLNLLKLFTEQGYTRVLPKNHKGDTLKIQPQFPLYIGDNRIELMALALTSFFGTSVDVEVEKSSPVITLPNDQKALTKATMLMTKLNPAFDLRWD